MAALVWDASGERLYETGISKAVLYVSDGAGDWGVGVAWNGITAITESPSGAEPTSLYADNIKYLSLLSAEEFAATLEAYMYPSAFEECDGTSALATGIALGQQSRTKFALCYRTEIGNDEDGTAHGHKIHIIYGCMASPSERAFSTINDSPEAITFSWELSTTPVVVTDHTPVSLLTIDSTLIDSADLTALEESFYGTDTPTDPTMLDPDAILALITP